MYVWMCGNIETIILLVVEVVEECWSGGSS